MTSGETFWWTRAKNKSYQSAKLEDLEEEARYFRVSGPNHFPALEEASMGLHIPEPDPHYEEEARIEDETAFNEYVQSLYFEHLTNDERVQVGRAWREPDITWQYGSVLHKDGLWPENRPATRSYVGRLGRQVLSGMLGAKAMSENDALRKISRKIEDQPLRRAILVGGAVVAVSTGESRANRFQDGATYRLHEEGTIIETFVGGDLSGDFRTNRVRYGNGIVTDSTSSGEAHWYAPAAEYTDARAYYLSPPTVAQALAYYLVGHEKRNPKTVYQSLMSRVASSRQLPRLGSATLTGFGNYGDDDGKMESAMLAFRLKQLEETGKNIQDGDEMMHAIVWPQHEEILTLIARPNGVSFVNRQEDKIMRDLFLPTNEIEEYLYALSKGIGGRTSPEAIWKVFEGLIKPSSAV